MEGFCRGPGPRSGKPPGWFVGKPIGCPPPPAAHGAPPMPPSWGMKPPCPCSTAGAIKQTVRSHSDACLRGCQATDAVCCSCTGQHGVRQGRTRPHGGLLAFCCPYIELEISCRWIVLPSRHHYLQLVHGERSLPMLRPVQAEGATLRCCSKMCNAGRSHATRASATSATSIKHHSVPRTLDFVP